MPIYWSHPRTPRRPVPPEVRTFLENLAGGVALAIVLALLWTLAAIF